MSKARDDVHVLHIPIDYNIYVEAKTRALHSRIGIRQLLAPEIDKFKQDIIKLVTPGESRLDKEEPAS